VIYCGATTIHYYEAVLDGRVSEKWRKREHSLEKAVLAEGEKRHLKLGGTTKAIVVQASLNRNHWRGRALILSLRA
jgi:hypothetical protein